MVASRTWSSSMPVSKPSVMEVPSALGVGDDGDAAEVGPAATRLHEAHLGVGYLVVTGPAAHLLGDLRQADERGGADRVRAHAAAGRVHRDVAVDGGGAGRDELGGASGLAEPQALVVAELEAGVGLLHL